MCFLEGGKKTTKKEKTVYVDFGHILNFFNVSCHACLQCKISEKLHGQLELACRNASVTCQFQLLMADVILIYSLRVRSCCSFPTHILASKPILPLDSLSPLVSLHIWGTPVLHLEEADRPTPGATDQAA